MRDQFILFGVQHAITDAYIDWHASIFRIHNNAVVWPAGPTNPYTLHVVRRWTRPPRAPLREDMIYGDKVATSPASIIYLTVTFSTAIRSIDAMPTTSVIFD